jgi:pyrroloquinoline quinone biosynthesis protein D
MNAPAARARVAMSEDSRPRLPRHARLQLDKSRNVWVILVPERVLVPDETAIEVVRLCDGVATVADIVDQLAKKYAAERSLIAADVIAMLQDLADKGYLVDGGGAKP